MSSFMCQSDVFNGAHCKVQCASCRPKPTTVEEKFARWLKQNGGSRPWEDELSRAYAAGYRRGTKDANNV